MKNKSLPDNFRIGRHGYYNGYLHLRSRQQPISSTYFLRNNAMHQVRDEIQNHDSFEKEQTS